MAEACTATDHQESRKELFVGVVFSVDREIPRREAVLIPAVIGVGQPHHEVICLQNAILDISTPSKLLFWCLQPQREEITQANKDQSTLHTSFYRCSLSNQMMFLEQS